MLAMNSLGLNINCLMAQLGGMKENKMDRKFYYENVPKLGNVAVSRHAQQRMDDEGVSQEVFEKCLLNPIKPDIPEGADMVWRERDGLRIVILLNPVPFRGAKLVKTVYRVKPQAVARR